MSSTLKSCCTHISQRWIFVLMGFLALLHSYALRICLSITITQMVVPLNETDEVSDGTCSNLDETFVNKTTLKTGTFEWSEYTQGVILSSFYWANGVTQIPGGMLAEKYGGKYTLGLSILFAGILSVITPSVISWGGSTAFVVIRILMGIFLGTIYPAANVMLSQWIPLEQRSVAGSLVFAGAPLGSVYATALSGVILEHSSIGWPAVFYFYGGTAILWFILHTILCYNSPSEHPFISEKEATFLHEQLSEHRHEKPPPIPWKHILTSKPVWALFAAKFGTGWGFLTMISDLNKYMNSVLKFSIKDNGYLSSLPFVCMWIGSLLSSWISDKLIMKKKLTTTNIRKIGSTVAFAGPAVFLLAASYAGCNRVVVMTMITLGMTLMGSSLPSVNVNALDLSPNYSGTVMAFSNIGGWFSGILAPYVVGVLTTHQTIDEWRQVFWIVVAVLLFINVIFVIYASGEVQEWNDPEFLKKKEERDDKSVKEEISLLPISSLNVD